MSKQLTVLSPQSADMNYWEFDATNILMGGCYYRRTKTYASISSPQPTFLLPQNADMNYWELDATNLLNGGVFRPTV